MLAGSLVASAPRGASAAVVVAPRVIESPPAGAVGPGAGRDVDVVVTVDGSGRVTAARPAEAKGDPSEASALAVAKLYRFAPATKDGAPVASRAKIRVSVAERRAPAVVPMRAPPATAADPARAAPLTAPLPAGVTEDVHVRGARTSPSITRRTMDRREIEAMPGAGGDALRTVESLPGVARAPALSGLLVVRGSAPQDTQVFVDGSDVPLAFHFGGLAAIVPTEVLERIDVYPGNYDVAYGRGMGGVVDVGLRSPARDAAHLIVKADILDARALVETPLDAKTRVLVAARRSYFDAWFPAVSQNLALGVTAAPVYFDAQAILERDLGLHTTARATFLASSDRIALTLPPSGDRDPALTGELSTATSFWRAQVRVDGKVDRARWMTMASVGHDTLSVSLGKLHGSDDVTRTQLRAEVDAPVARGVRMRTGVDVNAGRFAFDLLFPPVPTPDEPDVGPLFGRAPLHATRSTAYVSPAAFANVEVVPSAAWRVLLGVRADAFSDVSGVAVQPRGNVRYSLVPSYPRTLFKAAAGLFAQAPQPYENDATFGTPGLASQRAVHASVGLEQDLTRHVEVSIEPFYKRLDGLVSRRPDGAAASGFRYGNEGEGLVYGAELLLKYRPDARFWGWIAYTMSRSTRRALPEQEPRIFKYDQTHVLSAVGSYRLGRGWEAGLRARYVTGNPYTPAVGGAFDADAGTYAPIERRPLYTARLPSFFSVDVRVEKTWAIGERATVSVYLDVVNATNHRNAEGITSNFDWSQEGRVRGLPILPVLGVRGEL